MTNKLSSDNSYADKFALERIALDKLIEQVKTNSIVVSTRQRNNTENGQSFRYEEIESNVTLPQKIVSTDEFGELFDPSMQFVEIFVCHYWDANDRDRKGKNANNYVLINQSFF